MNDLEYMDEMYKQAYERLRVQSERYARGIREQEILKKVGSLVDILYWIVIL